MFNTKKYFLIALAVGLRGFTLGRAADNNSNNLTLGFIGASAKNAAYQVALVGARQAATDLGVTYDYKITIEDLTPPDPDPRLQVAAIEKLVHDKADGITLASTDHTLVPAAIDAAVNAGLQVATFDSDAPNSKRFFSYLSDHEQYGYTLMLELAKAMNGKGVVAILTGTGDSQQQKAHIDGIQAGAKVLPGITLKGIYKCSETTPDSVTRIAEVMKGNPDITGWILTESWPLSAPHAFPWAAGTVKCVAVGLLPNQLEYLRNGYVQMAVAQPYYEWGYRTVERLVYRLALSRKPPTPVEYSSITSVTPENVGDFAKTTVGWGVK